MSLLKERAEDYNFSELEKLRVNSSLTLSLEEYLFSSEKRPLFLLGPKGTGKTFNVMKTLRKVIQKKEDFLPAMFIYKRRNVLEPLNPIRLAPADVWGKRYLTLQSCLSKRELMRVADAIVYDDLHYRCEAIVQGKEDPNTFVNDLELILDEVERGKKVILISEDPLFYYAEKLNLRKLDEILPKFGQVPKSFDSSSLEEWEKFHEEMDYLAFREVPPLTFEDWYLLVEDYRIQLDDPTMNFLYYSSSKPRAFVRFAKLFEPKKEISIQDVQEKAREMIVGKINRKNVNFYDFLLQIPIIETEIEIKRFARVMERVGSFDNLMKLYKLKSTFEKVGEEVSKLLFKSESDEVQEIIRRLMLTGIKEVRVPCSLLKRKGYLGVMRGLERKMNEESLVVIDYGYYHQDYKLAVYDPKLVSETFTLAELESGAKEELTRRLKRAFKERPTEVQTILHEVTKKSVSDDRRRDVINFFRIYTSLNPHHIEQAYDTAKELERRIMNVAGRLQSSIAEKYLNYLLKKVPKYYIQVKNLEGGRMVGNLTIRWKAEDIPDYWLLYKPFEMAFSDVLYEMPTLKILS
jgi:hypothetical protein